MAVDTKELIIKETQRLIYEEKLEKLTVKDIVSACHITRQAFYYHFADIPELLKQILEQKGDELFLECVNADDIEGQIRYLLLLAVNVRPAIQKGLESKYGAELEKLVTENMEQFLRRLAEEKQVFQRCTSFEQEFIIRYHCQAIMGIVQHWSQEDTQNIDRIAHSIFMMTKAAAL